MVNNAGIVAVVRRLTSRTQSLSGCWRSMRTHDAGKQSWYRHYRARRRYDMSRGRRTMRFAPAWFQHHAVRIDRQHPLSDCVRLVNRRTDSAMPALFTNYVDGSEPVLNGSRKSTKIGDPSRQTRGCRIPTGTASLTAYSSISRWRPWRPSRAERWQWTTRYREPHRNSNDLPRKRHRRCHFSLLGWIERPGAPAAADDVSMSCSAVVCHLSQTRWPLDSKLVMP